MARPKVAQERLGIQIIGLKELKGSLESPEFRADMRRSTHAAVQIVKARVMQKLDNDILNRRSAPGLYGSVNSEVRDSGKSFIGIVGTHLKYARVHEYGATIRPKSSSGYLMFEIAGHMVRVKQVTIPARPVWGPAMMESSKRVNGLFQRAIVRQFARIARGKK